MESLVYAVRSIARIELLNSTMNASAHVTTNSLLWGILLHFHEGCNVYNRGGHFEQLIH
jgi:hypothetical protein